MKLGDTNTKFFHTSVKVRQSVNAIHRLVREDGTVIVGYERIKYEIREFYRSLIGSAAEYLTMVDKSTVGRGPKLSIYQQRALAADCTEKEW